MKMLRYEFTEPLFTNTSYSGKSCQDHITNRMTTWYLFQLREDLSLAVGVAEGYINNIIQDGFRPASLAGADTIKKPIYEYQAFIFALRAFAQYVTKFEKESNDIIDKEERLSTLRRTLCGVVDTKVKVVGKEIMMFSDDVELMEYVRDKALEAGYLFRTIMVKDEAQKWWEPITKDR